MFHINPYNNEVKYFFQYKGDYSQIDAYINF